MKRNIKRFIEDENGQALVEYALILCVLTTVSLGAIKVFMMAWKNRFDMLKEMRSGILGMEP